MRISTNQMFQIGLRGMLAQSEKITQLQQQIASEKRVINPSDDPIAAAKINLMNQRISATEQLDKNRLSAQAALASEESVLSRTVGAIQQLREIQIRSSSDALSEADRKSLSVEAKQLLGQIQQLSNAQDNEGNYIFGGSKTSTQPFTGFGNNQFIYNGDETQRFQEVSGGSRIPITDVGNKIFMQIKNGNKDFSITDAPPLNTGTVALTTGSVVDRFAYVADDYTLQFVLNSNNEMVVMVAGSFSGNVLPTSGLPDDAPLYKEGQTISFNGIEITATGQPQAGDSFSVNQSQNESIFSTVQRMIDSLNKPFSSPSDRANTVTENNQLLAQLDNALETVLGFQAEVGSRLKQLDIAELVNTDLISISRVTLKELEDIDLAEVISNLSMQNIYLEVTRQTFMKIQELSAFRYL